MAMVLTTMSQLSIGQHDFKISWNAYTTGETIEEDPFNGSFTISNVGESTIPANDTIWYGYFVDDSMYDIALNPEMVSGEVLEEDFEPGDEFVIINIFVWPLLGSGITIDFCAVVYGIGFGSYTGEYFTGDDVDSNNTDCLFAVLPEYVVGLSDKEDDITAIKFSNHHLFVSNASATFKDLTTLEIYSLDGRLIHAQRINFDLDEIQIELPELGSGAYVGLLISETAEMSKKFVIQY
ncbi:MAG: T9SS type A sorting domain-containing protein [Crocinitomix sp.]|nr:T9SS type A sorting domain-containing protein [Crocinitomix sp.]